MNKQSLIQLFTGTYTKSKLALFLVWYDSRSVEEMMNDVLNSQLPIRDVQVEVLKVFNHAYRASSSGAVYTAYIALPEHTCGLQPPPGDTYEEQIQSIRESVNMIAAAFPAMFRRSAP